MTNLADAPAIDTRNAEIVPAMSAIDWALLIQGEQTPEPIAVPSSFAESEVFVSIVNGEMAHHVLAFLLSATGLIIAVLLFALGGLFGLPALISLAFIVSASSLGAYAAGLVLSRRARD